MKFLNYLFTPDRRNLERMIKDYKKNPNRVQEKIEDHGVCEVGQTVIFNDGTRVTLLADEGDSVLIHIEEKPSLWQRLKNAIKSEKRGVNFE